MIKIGDYQIKPTMFPDGTSQVWKLPSELLFPGSSVVHWKFENEAEIIQLAQLKTLLDASSVTALLDIRTLPYARQDKAVSNDATFALRTFAYILNGMGWDAVLLHDPHSSSASDLILNSRASYYIYEAGVAAGLFDTDVLCFPDAGAQKKYKPMFPDADVVTATKKRNQQTGEVTFGELDGVVAGCNVLIVDDICDGGATFVKVAKALRDAGADDVALFVSHGIFSKGLEPLLDGGISRIFTPEGERFK